MIQSRYLSTAALAALLATAPAWATDTTKAKPTTTSANATSTTAAKPLCSELHHPQAGKLADKDTGMAKDHSASPVHMDCTPDADATAAGVTPKNTGYGNSSVTRSEPIASPAADPAASTTKQAPGSVSTPTSRGQ